MHLADPFEYFPSPRGIALRSILTLVVAGMSSVGAIASGPISIGIGTGLSHGKVDCLAALPCDHSDSSFKVYAGYELTPTFDVRLAYFDDGRYKGADTTPLGTPFGGTFKLSGAALTAGYLWAFAPAWSLHGQAGVASVHARFSYADPFFGSAGKTTSQPIAGATLGYAPTPELRLGLDYDVTRFKAHATHGPLQTLGLSAQYAF